ncbi:acriflavine resistance protein B [Aliidongia dinghuensis]|uniref:Acriflavine resistance protein B n=1 Tax=Aliidongia dinghuensis TaxID=1867774 RepID=A0A8J2Z0A6_9PROT|nr:efflux RND transporter permease subunit [Aliidongia dinghuensis]GGF49637.1 acriflavine resistance protein B [Aliidongia dinghuensis]
MNIPAFFIRRPIPTGLLMVAILALGVVGYSLLPIATLPQVDFPTIQVSAALPGASAETMASSVAAPLERALAQLPGVLQLTSSSTLGKTSINIQFALDRQIDGAAQDVQTAINSAEGDLPKNLPSPPTYHKSNPAIFPILSLMLTSPSLPIERVDAYADDYLIPQLARIEGVGLVDMNGEQKPAIRIQVRPATLSGLGLTLEDVRSAIAQATVDGPKGLFDGDSQSTAIAANDQLTDIAGFRNLVIAHHAGRAVQLKDVADVLHGAEDVRNRGWFNRDRAIMVDVHQQPGYNVAATVDRVKAALPIILKTLPPSIKATVFGDRTQTIRATVADVERTLILSVLLVVAVVYAFLREWRATLIPSLAIPLALVGTFGVMELLGYSLDNFSLMGLAIAVGFVVDDAIVVVENTARHLAMGKGARQAAIDGAGEVAFTILSITVSLVAVFIPILFMGGIVGRIFREFAVTVSVAVLISGVVSVTLSPMLCAHLLRRNAAARDEYETARGFARLTPFYARSLRWALRHPGTMLLVTMATLAVTVTLYAVTAKGFIPEQDTSQLAGVTEAAPDISSAAMAEKQQEIARIVLKDPDVVELFSSLGSNGLNTGRMTINLRPVGERRADAQTIIQRLRRAVAPVAGAALFLQQRQDIQVGARPSKTQYQYTIEDPNVGELFHWAPILTDALRTLPELTGVTSDLQAQGPQTNLAIDRTTAARLGVTVQQIDDVLYDAFGQRQVATIFSQLDQTKVVLELEPRWQRDQETLASLYVRSSETGGLVPLNTFVSLGQSLAPLSINHQDQTPAVTLSFNLAPGVALGEAVSAVEAARQRIQLPDTIMGGFQGTAQAFKASLSSQPYLILAAILAIYLVLGMLYQSLLHPITILSTLPSAGLGALLALGATGFELSVVGVIGILLLIGIVKKNGIMMVDFALEAERGQGLPAAVAIYDAAILRFRPIMMTTMAALLGAVPLALGRGAGAELQRPLGIAIVGGLVVSQVLTLYTTPVVYVALDRLAQALHARRGKAVAPQGSTPQGSASRSAD